MKSQMSSDTFSKPLWRQAIIKHTQFGSRTTVTSSTISGSEAREIKIILHTENWLRSERIKKLFMEESLRNHLSREEKKPENFPIGFMKLSELVLGLYGFYAWSSHRVFTSALKPINPTTECAVNWTVKTAGQHGWKRRFQAKSCFRANLIR